VRGVLCKLSSNKLRHCIDSPVIQPASRLFVCVQPARGGSSLARSRLLLVDDDESVLSGLKGILEAHEFEVITASNVIEALTRITSESFEVVITDLHMPGAGDGLIVVNAMRQVNPKAVTIVLSANPDMRKATAAILRQADKIMLKPVRSGFIVQVIRQRLAQQETSPGTQTEIPHLASSLGTLRSAARKATH
jgi:DNA-binding NtrC family response regulator